MNSRVIACCAMAAALMGLPTMALARNPHCAGGIQYVVQGMRDKDKGNVDDYQRQMGKAIQQLEQCVAEDPKDLEAFGYLGWAYAEIDSARAAGKAFDTAIQGLTEKGDKKKAEWASSNRLSYWARYFNDGIEKIRVAREAYPEFTKKPENDSETTLRAEAEKRYQEALTSLTRASCLRPGDPQTLRNLGSIHAFMGDFQKAEATFQEGLKGAPGDSSLQESIRASRINYANSLVEAKKYDEAIGYYANLLKAEPNAPEHHLGLADAYFRKASAMEADARKPVFKSAGESYAKAAELKSGDADLPFNAALAFQNAGDYEKAEVNWRLALKVRPDDVDAMSSLGATLAELKKYDEAVRILHQAVNLKPQNKNLHRQLGAVYTKAGNNQKATEELMVFLAMQNGQPVTDAAAQAKAARDGSAAAKTLATDGVPDQVIPWEADNEKYETWFYWNKKSAYTFKSGTLVTKSDWSTADIKGGSSTSKKKS